ncbi:MAG: DUF3152 domain-containing protein [Acidimicrobiales bacterium]|nr:DUF3152 domain-containing protein [Acidimicrobiales bacterium]
MAGVVTVLAVAWVAVDLGWGGESGDPMAEAEAGVPVSVASAPTTSPQAERAVSAVSPPSDPAGVTLPVGAVGEFLPAAAPGGTVGTGPPRTYDVEVEAATGVDPVGFAEAVEAILADARSWIGDGSVAFQRVPAGGSFTVTLATPPTTDQICLPLNTAGILSCREGDRVIINLTRWLEGTTEWDGSLEEYRAMVINHEVGHALGHGHLGCPGPGQLAPVMMQQTKGLDGCIGNPWPFPGP